MALFLLPRRLHDFRSGVHGDRPHSPPVVQGRRLRKKRGGFLHNRLIRPSTGITIPSMAGRGPVCSSRRPPKARLATGFVTTCALITCRETQGPSAFSTATCGHVHAYTCVGVCCAYLRATEIWGSAKQYYDTTHTYAHVWTLKTVTNTATWTLTRTQTEAHT